MTKGIDMLNIFDLDLKFKVTEPFEGQKGGGQSIAEINVLYVIG